MTAPMRPFLLALLLLAVLPVVSRAQELRTIAESSGFTQTSTHADVVAFCEALEESSDVVTLGQLGVSSEGRTLPMLIIADPPVADAEAARRSGKLVALLIGNIHAGEVCGKEALQMLAREIATTPDHRLLDDYVLCIAPIYNADGNERMAPDNRPGQDGPERMGVRHNAQNLDLNRDFIKAEAPETRALLRAFRTWNPDVFIDTHTTNGSHHRYVLTYSGPKHPGGDVELLRYVRDTMLPRVSESLRESHGHETFTYGNFAEDHTRWTTFPAAPRYSTNYAGLRNTIGILTEAYSYASFEDRVLATLDFCRAVLEDVAAHRTEVEALRKAADERARSGSARTEPTPVRTGATALAEKATVKGFVEVEENGRSRPTEEPRDYEVEVIDEFVARDEVDRPWAYVVPADAADVAEHLRLHGVTVEVLREDVETDAEVYALETLERAEREFQGHRTVRADAEPRTEARRLHAGDFVVPVDQSLGHLAVATLEPEADDSLLTWNFFDGLSEGDDYPVLRLPESLPLLTTELPSLEEAEAPKERVTYEVLNDRRRRPDLDGSPMRSVEWRDDGHYIVSRGGDRWLVEASTGRYLEKVAGEDTSAVESAIATLSGIDDRDARRIRIADRAAGVGLFEHAGDLYAVSLSGDWARRLTADPAEEELGSLSPDGVYAAFVRDHDLYTVETLTGIERRLTTTGTEKVRNGKHAWVYFEEIFGRSWKGYWWSPDGSSIAYYETDSTDVDTFTIIDDAVEPQEIETTEYPKPGRPNPEVRIGIVSAAGGEPRFVDLTEYTAGSYIVSGVGWWPDSSKIHLTVQDRAQTWLDLATVGRSGGRTERLLRDRTDAWITAPSLFRILDDGTFLLSSERSGYDHVYRYSADGILLNQVTSGPWEFRGVERLDQEAGRLWFNCTADSPIATSLYAVNLDGAGLTRITRERGSHSTSVSPGGSYVADFWSSADQPPQAALLDGEGNLVRTLDTNPVFELDRWDLGESRLVQIPASRSTDEEQIHLEAQLIYPPEFDRGRRYPVWFLTYAGPHAPTIRDTWAGGRLNEQMLAASGFIVCRGDPYSASGKGARSAWTAYRRLGVPEMEDIDDIMRWLKNKPYVDGSRIGMSGFSYGGFMTAYAMTHSAHFAAGIAGGSVTSWNDYDTIYTERYMDTPQENPEGYEATNVVNAAGDLHGRILLVHGMMDDNVHVQNTIKLARALQDAEKDFEMMLYPRFRHGIWSDHYRRLTYEFQMRLVEQGRSERPSEEESILHQPRAESDDAAREPGRRRTAPERPETSGQR